MRLLILFSTLLLVGLVSSAPAGNATKNDEILEITEELFDDSFVIYTAEHDIVNLFYPLNALNFDDDTDEEDESNGEETTANVLFFVLADNENGQRVDQGLYVRKKGVVTKLLDYGRDAAGANDDAKTAYFAAKDGIYSYNLKENRADKYGSLTDSIISIAKVNGSDILYIATEDHFLYKVSEEGTKKEKIEGAVNVNKIILDFENTLFYITEDKKVYYLGEDGVKSVAGLPEQPSYSDIFKPPFVMDSGIPVVMDNQVFVAYPNGTSESTDFKFIVKPSAYELQATLVQYYGYNKKIYEYNILELMFSVLGDGLKNFLEDKADSISEIATRSRSDLRP